ncbi:MAG: 1-deoxy-D-xylulose-5-phosphate synthase, partial [Bacteroidales bacterium]|nr:1-deoxy-D-xylulose-5-phosphate synthase [Bacteroidales bacterium]
DVGIAEQHAVTFSAGLAISGMVPFCNIYSSFMQRAYDQVIHDVAIQKLNVVFCLDRGGLVGADGATHHGVYDLSFLRSVPNLIVSSPMDEIELRHLMYTAQLPDQGPFSIRYPRGVGSHDNWQQPFEAIPVGKGRCLRKGDAIAVLSLGPIGVKVGRICEALSESGLLVGHYDMRFVKPLDTDLLHEVFSQYKAVVTVEDGTIIGGMGTAVIEFMSDHGYHCPVKRLGLPDQFIDHGSQMELFKEVGLDMESMKQTLLNLAASLRK